jgi:PAS domain S-box-containing protein
MRRFGDLNPTPPAILIATVLAALIVVSVTSLWRFDQARSEARRARDVRERVADCLEDLLDSETGQRGYLLTGRDAYLDDYRRGATTMPARFAALEEATRGDAEQRARVQQLREIGDAKMRELANTVVLMRAGQRDKALAIVVSDEGKQLMDRARAIAVEIRDDAGRRLDRRFAEIGRGFRVAFAVDGAAALITMLLGGLLLGINRNIRRRQELEVDLRRQTAELGFSREQLKITLSSIGDAVIATDREGNVTFINAVAQSLTGWNDDTAIGRPLLDVFKIIGEETRLPAENPVEKVIRKGGIVGLANHTLLIRRDGTETAIADSAAPIRSGDGALGGVVLVFRDVSDVRREQRRAEFLARAAVELGSSLDWETTLRTVTRLAVPAFADWAAVDLVDANGETRRLSVAHIDPEKIALVEELERRWPADRNAAQGVHNIVRTGKSEMMADIPASLLEAAARDAEHGKMIKSLGLRSYIGAPLRVGSHVMGAITFVMAESNRRYTPLDLTAVEVLCDRAATAMENARLYREAQRLRVDAEMANRAKDEFLAMLGHELRNPLAPIVTALHLVRQRVGTQIDRELKVIDRQLRHVVRLVDDLLDVSRIARGQITLTKEPVEIGDVINKAIELARPIIDEKRHRLRVDVAPALMVSGDPVRLTQVMANLLNNSAKYTDAGGELSVSAVQRGDRVVIRVRDNGIGIAPDVLPRVFDLFVQETQSIDRAKGGLGLGLAIVRNLVRAHGGTVTAHSEGTGKGSEMVVELPILAALGQPASPSPDGHHAAAPRNRRLLVVDDNADAAELLAESLSLVGYEAHKATDAAAALEVAAKVQPAIALLDLGLPVIDGYELARRLRALDGLGGLRVIAVTGYGQASDRERSRQAGFDAHLVKPITIEAVQRVLESLD